MMAIGGGGIGKSTQAAGTRIREILGGAGGLFTHLRNFQYTPGATTHLATVMRDASSAKAASALAAAGTALVVDTALTDGDTNAIAANDVLAIKLNTGEWHLSTISAWSAGTKTATLNTAIPTGKSVLKGAPVFCYGVEGDTFHAKNTFDLTTGATRTFPNTDTGEVSLTRARSPGAPLIISSDNATNAGTLNYANWLFAKR